MPSAALLVAPTPVLVMAASPSAAAVLASAVDAVAAAADQEAWRNRVPCDPGLRVSLDAVGDYAVRAGRGTWAVPVFVDAALVLCAVSQVVAERLCATARASVGLGPAGPRSAAQAASEAALEFEAVSTSHSGQAGAEALASSDRLVVSASGLRAVRHGVVRAPPVSGSGRRDSLRQSVSAAVAGGAGVLALQGVARVTGWTAGDPAEGRAPALLTVASPAGPTLPMPFESLCVVELEGTKTPVSCIQGSVPTTRAAAQARTALAAAAGHETVMILASAEASMALVRQLGRRAWA